MRAGGGQLSGERGTVVTPLILCGGSGKRLWPISRQLLPKQLLRLESQHSMLQSTALRTHGEQFGPPVVTTGEDHRFIVQEQLGQIGVEPEAIILEPVRRNTAPAIALAALWAGKDDPERLLLAMPSDQVIGDDQKFKDQVLQACQVAKTGRIVTFGIRPTRPETGFGYIEAGALLDCPCPAHEVIQFREKPDGETAAKFISTGGFYWNGGIFLFRADTFLNELGKRAPDILAACEAAMAASSVDGNFIRPGSTEFASAPDVSFDYAIMENTDCAAVVPATMEWSDLGSWQALWELSEKDPNGNVLSENTVAVDSTGCLLRTETDTTIAVVGAKNLVVVATRDAILVVPRDRSQEASKAIDGLHGAGIDRAQAHTRVYRPWGSYEVMDQGERFQTKRIIVKPGGVLSLQMHHQRSEHWVVVSGTARVTINGESRLLQENESTFVSAGSTHRLENPGKIPLHLIEIQCGPYLGEDDIVRLEDVYGRAPESRSGQ